MPPGFRTRVTDEETGQDAKWNPSTEQFEPDTAGSGDMVKATYDPDDDGKVAEAELVLSYPTHDNSLDHTQGTDQGLDSGGANAVTAEQTKTAYTHSQAAHAPSNAQKNSDITKSEIEAVLTGEISSHSHAGGGGESESVVVATQDTANATVNLANATGLTFEALANSTYIIEVFLLWAASATTVGIKVSATASGSPTIQSGVFLAQAANGTPDSSGWNANDVVVTTSASPFTTNNMGTIH